jgi:hypothetical protein
MALLVEKLELELGLGQKDSLRTGHDDIHTWGRDRHARSLITVQANCQRFILSRRSGNSSKETRFEVCVYYLFAAHYAC